MITGGISIVAFASGVGLPVGIALSGTSLLLSLTAVVIRKSSRIFTVKQEKHDTIKLLPQSKLDSIADIVSQAMQHGDISSTSVHKVLQEVEKYRKLKADIRNQAKAKAKAKVRLRLRKQGKEDFFTKNCKYFRYPGCQCHLKYEVPPPYDM